MTFIHFSMLFGLLATLIPIILHILNRRRAKDLDWGAMQFLLGSLVNRRRRILLEEMMLLAMRCLLMALIVLAIARPIVPADSNTPWILVLPLILLGTVTLGVGTAFWQERVWRYRLWAAGAAMLLVSILLSSAEQYLQLGRLAGPERDVAIVIDGSSSMRIKVGDQTNFERAKGEAREMVRTLGRAVSVNVILAGAAADVKMQQFSSNHEETDRLLKDLEPVGGSFAVHEAIRAATASLKNGSNSNKEIVVFTDGQKSGWNLADTAKWNETIQSLASHSPKPELYCRTFALPESVRNLAITQMTPARRVIGTDLPLPMDLTIENTGNLAIEANTVELSASGQKVERSFRTLEPGESERLRLTMRFEKAGPQIIEARMTVDDDLEDDNSRQQVVHVMQQLPVLVVNGNPARRLLDRASGYIQLALNPRSLAEGKASANESRVARDPDNAGQANEPGLIHVTAVDATRLASVQDLDQFRAIVLADVPRLLDVEAQRIAEFVARGGGLLCLPGAGAQKDFYNDWKLAADGTAVLPGKFAQYEEIRAGSDPVEFAFGTFLHPALTRFADDGKIDLDETRIYSYWKLLPNQRDEAGRGGNLINGEPFLLTHQLGQGQVLMSAVAFDSIGSNLVARRDFPVLTHSLVYHVADSARAELTQPAGPTIDVRFTSRTGRPLSFHSSQAGLLGEYFNGTNFENRVGQRIDSTVDFDWGSGSPLAGVTPDNFSVRWTGYLLPERSGEYTISVTRDDRARVWLDDRLIIDATEQAKVQLDADRRHALRVELVEEGGSASVRLRWASQSLPQQVIAADRLVHDDFVAQPADDSDGFEVVGPKGSALPVRSAVAQGAALNLKLGGASVPGIYRVKAPVALGDALVHLEDEDQMIPFAVVSDPSASQVATLTDDDRTSVARMADINYLTNFDQVMSVAKGETVHQPLWRYLAVAFVIILLAEVALARWIAMQRQTTTAEVVDFQDKSTPTPAFHSQMANLQQPSPTGTTGLEQQGTAETRAAPLTK